MGEQIGLPESISIAIGGMVGGGIFAVLGVVASAAGPATWIAFALAGIVALCAGYSFIYLNARASGSRGPIGQIEEFTDSTRLAGMTGWLFTFGYVGTMAMYAFAFGSYLRDLVGIPMIIGLPTRPLFSVALVVVFVGVNALGAVLSGRAEDLLVALKVGILLIFAGGGLYYGVTHGQLTAGIATVGIGPLTAAAIAFVAFEGWELLLFDQDAIADPESTIRRAIYVSIVATTLLYIAVAVVTTNLVPVAVIRAHAETALAVAAEPFLGQVGFTLIAVAAVVSTASALNATLFSTARLANQMAEAAPEAMADQDLRSDGGIETFPAVHADRTPTHRSADENPGGPMRSLLVLGTLTGIFTLYGNLNSITSFASGAFITIFGGMCALAFRERDDRLRTAVLPAIGVAGSIITVSALLWHLHETNPDVLVTVAVIWTTVLSVYWLPRHE